MFGLGLGEMAIIAVIAVVLFGGRKLPEIGTGLGEGIRNFRKAYREAKAIDISSPPKPVDGNPSNETNNATKDS